MATFKKINSDWLEVRKEGVHEGSLVTQEGRWWFAWACDFECSVSKPKGTCLMTSDTLTALKAEVARLLED